VGALFERFFKAPPEPASPAQEPDAPGALVQQARAFQDLHVGDVMKPRADIIAIDRSAPFSEVVALFADAEHSRLPVYKETLDEPVGVVHVKDVFKLLARKTRRPKPEDHILNGRHHLVRKVLYVPASMRAAELLSLMRSRRTHMALVIDEFGGTDGLVTLEDLLERLVGDISDEHDEVVDSGFTPIVEEEDSWLVDGRTPLAELEGALAGVDLAPPDMDEDIDTVAGLVMALAGHVPQRGERIEHPGGYVFQVIAADPRRVKRVRVTSVARAAGEG
jgi:CBS domain containing-hemolysin-like protein